MLVVGPNRHQSLSSISSKRCPRRGLVAVATPGFLWISLGFTALLRLPALLASANQRSEPVISSLGWFTLLRWLGGATWLCPSLRAALLALTSRLLGVHSADRGVPFRPLRSSLLLVLAERVTEGRRALARQLMEGRTTLVAHVALAVAVAMIWQLDQSGYLLSSLMPSRPLRAAGLSRHCSHKRWA